MSRREFDRSAIMARVASGSISLTEATPLLCISYRQAKRLYARYKARGASGLIHAGAGRISNRAHPLAERQMVISLVRAHYGGEREKGSGQRFGPTLTAEHLWSDHGVLVPVNTLARWMSDEGLWSRARKTKSVQHPRRERCDHFGELVQLDGSFHDWFEGRGGVEEGCLMTMVDDASGDNMLLMGKEETIWAAANVLKSWISDYGVPRALYTDWKNVYKRTPTWSELKRGETEVFTQFGRMCAKLGVEIIAASSPQAKGRVERAHGMTTCSANTLGLTMRASLCRQRVRWIITPSETGVPFPTMTCSALNRSGIVGNDHVVQYGGRYLQLDRAARGRVPAKSKVLVRETEDGRLRVILVTGQGRDRSERALKWTEAAGRTTRALNSPTPDISPSNPSPEAESKPQNPKPWKPGSNHPWRAQHHSWAELARLRQDAADVHP